MKKLIIITLVIVMVLGLATMATANDSGFILSGTNRIEVCNDNCEGQQNCDGNNGFCRIRVDGNKIAEVTGNGNDVVLKFEGRIVYTGNTPHIVEIPLGDDYTLFVYLQGNKIRDIGDGTRIEKRNTGESETEWREWDGKVTRTISSSNIGVNLYQVNRNHWAKVLPTLPNDDSEAFNILMARNGNVNLAEVGGNVTLEVKTERWGAEFNKSTNQMISGTKKQLPPSRGFEVIDFSEANRRFFPYDAGSPTFPISVSHENVTLNFMLSVLGNTTLLPTSWMKIDAHGDSSTTGVNGQWFRVMSGHQGTH